MYAHAYKLLYLCNKTFDICEEHGRVLMEIHVIKKYVYPLTHTYS